MSCKNCGVCFLVFNCVLILIQEEHDMGMNLYFLFNGTLNDYFDIKKKWKVLETIYFFFFLVIFTAFFTFWSFQVDFVPGLFFFRVLACCYNSFDLIVSDFVNCFCSYYFYPYNQYSFLVIYNCYFYYYN